MKSQTSAVFAVGVTALASITSTAAADVSGLQLRMTDDAAEVVVNSDASLGKPRIRAERGEVEVWFPNVADNSRFTATGDGTAILRARLRPGMGASAVLDIDVGGKRKVDVSLVTIEAKNDTTTIVRIPRSQLPSVAPASVIEAPKPIALPVVAPVAVAVEKTVAVAAPTQATAAPVAPVANIANVTKSLGTKPAKAAAKATKETPIASGGDSKLPIMLWMTLVLGVMLGGIKLWQRKTTSLLTEPDIEVVASKRLGPGLQLFIVRAFGQEHLLSVNGKSTERIATNESFEDFDSAAASIRPAFTLPNDPGVQLTPSRSVLSNTAAPTRSHAPINSGNIGASVLDIHIPPTALRPMPAPRSTPITTSQSIAGLIRLREQLDRVN